MKIIINMTRKSIPKAMRRIVYDKCGGHCAYCGCKLKMEDMQVDHVIAVATSFYVHGQEPDHSLNNLLPSCRQCNFYKGDWPLEGFRKNLLTLMDRVQKPFIWRLAEKYGMVQKTEWDGKFYFEKLNN